MIIDADNVKYFINKEGFYRREHPHNREYRIFRRNKTIKSENGRNTMLDELQYGVGEFFYNRDGQIESYDDTVPKLHDVPIDELIMELERLETALKKPMIVIEEIPHKDKDGYVSIVSTETRLEMTRRRSEERRIKEIEERRKGRKDKNE